MTPKENLKDNLLAPKRQEPDAELDQLARLVIGAAIEVHRHLGPVSWKRFMRRLFVWSSTLEIYRSCARNE
jgi:hypothetical protein